MVKPLALSFKSESSLEVITVSDISRPTLYDGLFEYGSNTMTDFGTLTKVPLIKYIPASTPTADPIRHGSSDRTVNIVSPAFNVVFPYVTFSLSVNISSWGNISLIEFVPDSLYFTKSVISSTPSVGGKI